MNYLVEPIQTFKGSTRTNIAIFRPFTSTDESLYQNLADICANLGTVEIVNEVFLNSFEAMNRDIVDILIVPELEMLQKKLYYPLKKYMDAGGAVIFACDDYFMTGKILDDEFSQFDVEAVAGDAYYRATSAFLGIKPYASDITPTIAASSSEWIADSKTVPTSLPKAGVQMNVSSDKVSPYPPDGHVFIERYEVLRNYDAVIGCDNYGRKVNSQVTFAHNWETGARYALYSSNQKNSVIRKSNPLFESTLKAAIQFCENKIFAVSCFPNYACYKPNEDVAVTYEVQNAGKTQENIDITLEIFDCDKNSVFVDKNSITLNSNTPLKNTVYWKNCDFSCDSYSIVLSVSQNGRLLSKAENGFVIWNEEIIKQGLSVHTSGKYFDINGKSSMITGTNYYESNIGEVMWVKPNIKKLEEDFKQMSDNGINYIRIHYHHVKWFKDYLKNCTGHILDYYKDLEDDYLPSERILRIFDAHIYLSQKYHIIYGGDLFTLLPEELGDPKGWYGVQDYVWFEDKLKAQKEFLDCLIPRYVNVPGIAWDIYNEPCCVFCDPYIPTFNQTFYNWALKIKEHMRALGDTHLITIGAEHPDRFGDALDFYAEHTNFKFIRERKTQTTLPEIIQECWLDRPATPVGDQLQLNDIKQAITDVLELGFSGFVPWQWTNQQRLWCDWRTYVGEIWDDRLGTCVRNDGTLKPAGRFYKDFVTFIDGLDFISCNNGIITTSAGRLSVEYDNNKDRRIRFYENEEIVREIGQKCITGKTLSVRTDSNADLFYISSTHDIDYIKANQPGILTIEAKQTPIRICVCDEPEGNEIVDIESSNTSSFQLTIQESDINYWFKLTY